MKRLLYTLIALVTLSAICPVAAQARKMKDLKIYINPGHGGYTSNDRPIRIYPFAQNDTLGYWESKSNLYKGLHMYHILDSLGTKAYLSRIKNTEDDDRSLSGIAAEANKLGVDLFYSIHSNAGETVNYPLMLYREQVEGTPRYPENVTISKILWQTLHSNQLPHWTRHTEYVAGDLTFYKNMWSGGLGVLRTLYIPGLLSEGGMHEHRPEAYRLMNDDYLWLEAWHFVHATMEFFNTEDRFVTGNVAGLVYDDNNLREKDMPVTFTRHGRDRFAPINGAYVELLDASGKLVQKRTTDNMYNGIYVFRNVKPGNYKVRISHDKYYTEEQNVTVTANEVSYLDNPMNMRREMPLQIVEFTPVATEGQPVSCASKITMKFNTDVDHEAFEKAFSITPELDGYLRWSNSYTEVEFVPTLALAQSTTYTVRVTKEARTADKHYANPNLENEFTYTFATSSRDRVELIDNFPAEGGTIHYQNPTLEFRFDNKIQTTEILDLVKIKDSKGNALSLNRRSCKFNQLSNNYGNAQLAISGNLQIGEKYSLTIPGELRDIETLPLTTPVTVNFSASDQSIGNDQGEVIDDFDATTPAFAYVADQTTGIGTTLPGCIRSTSSKLFGSAAARITYTFTDSHDGSIAWAYNGAPHQFETGDKVGIFVNGDFNNHVLSLGFTSGTDTKYAKLTDVNFLGWKYCEVTLDMLEENYTYVFSHVKVDQVESPITQKGGISLDNLTIIKGTGGVDDVIADSNAAIALYPNPATDVVNIQSTAEPATIEVINANGATVSVYHNTKTLSVEGLASGTYFVRITTADGATATRTLIVK